MALSLKIADLTDNGNIGTLGGLIWQNPYGHFVGTSL